MWCAVRFIVLSVFFRYHFSQSLTTFQVNNSVITQECEEKLNQNITNAEAGFRRDVRMECKFVFNLFSWCDEITSTAQWLDWASVGCTLSVRPERVLKASWRNDRKLIPLSMHWIVVYSPEMTSNGFSLFTKLHIHYNKSSYFSWSMICNATQNLVRIVLLYPHKNPYIDW